MAAFHTFVVFAVLCASALATVSSSVWITAVSTGSSLPGLRELAIAYDVYGEYGLGSSKVFLIRGTANTAEKLKELGFKVEVQTASSHLISDADALLWALEVPPKPRAPNPMRQLSHMLSEHPHFAVEAAGVFFAHVPIKTTVNWPKQVQDIRVPSRRIRLPPANFSESPAFKYLKNVSANEIIADAVARVSKDELYATDFYLSENFFSRQSASTGIQEASVYLQNRFRSYGLTVTTQTYRSDYAPNIIAERRGDVEPDKIVVVGAHYDSRSVNVNDPAVRAPGADDNGSGTSAIVELARVVTNTSASFVYTIRFVLFSGEEQGLLGSEAYANSLAALGADVVAMFNADMLGYRIPGQPIEMGMKDRSITEWLLSVSFQVSALYVPDMPVKLSSSCCSDYISFYENGYPAIGFFENPTTAATYPSYHTSTDVIANLDFDQLKKETGAVLANLLTFAVPK